MGVCVDGFWEKGLFAFSGWKMWRCDHNNNKNTNNNNINIYIYIYNKNDITILTLQALHYSFVITTCWFSDFFGRSEPNTCGNARLLSFWGGERCSELMVMLGGSWLTLTYSFRHWVSMFLEDTRKQRGGEKMIAAARSNVGGSISRRTENFMVFQRSPKTCLGSEFRKSPQIWPEGAM